MGGSEVMLNDLASMLSANPLWDDTRGIGLFRLSWVL